MSGGEQALLKEKRNEHDLHHPPLRRDRPHRDLCSCRWPQGRTDRDLRVLPYRCLRASYPETAPIEPASPEAGSSRTEHAVVRDRTQVPTPSQKSAVSHKGVIPISHLCPLLGAKVGCSCAAKKPMIVLSGGIAPPHPRRSTHVQSSSRSRRAPSGSRPLHPHRERCPCGAEVALTPLAGVG